MRSVLVRRLLYTSFMTTKTSLQIFKAPWNFGGGEFHGAMSSSRRASDHSGGMAAKATACEDTSYYNEKLLAQQPRLFTERKTPAQHL